MSIIKTLSIIAFSLFLTPVVSAELASSTTTGNVQVIAGDDVGAGGAQAGSRRSLSPRMQTSADYDGAETGYVTFLRDPKRRHNFGRWKFSIKFPTVYAVSTSGKKVRVGSFSAAGAYHPAVSRGNIYRRPSPIYMFSPQLDGMRAGLESLRYNEITLSGRDSRSVPKKCSFKGMEVGRVCTGGQTILYWVK